MTAEQIVIAAYGTVSGLIFIFPGLLAFYFEEGVGKRNGARAIFLAPVWPGWLAYGLFIGLRHLWRATGWSVSR